MSRERKTPTATSTGLRWQNRAGNTAAVTDHETRANGRRNYFGTPVNRPCACGVFYMLHAFSKIRKSVPPCFPVKYNEIKYANFENECGLLKTSGPTIVQSNRNNNNENAINGVRVIAKISAIFRGRCIQCSFYGKNRKEKTKMFL